MNCADCAVGDCVNNTCVPVGLSFCAIPQSFASDSNWISGMEQADFNHDGKLDLVISVVYLGDLNILLGNGDGSFQVQSLPVDGSAETVAVGA